MQDKTSSVFLGFVLILCVGVVVWLAYQTRLSLSFLAGVLVGGCLGAGLVIIERRKDENKQGPSQQGMRWVAIGSVIGIVIVGMVRIIGDQDVFTFIMSVAGAMMITILSWSVFFFKPISTGAHISPTTDTWRPTERESWREAQKHRSSDTGDWRDQRRRK